MRIFKVNWPEILDTLHPNVGFVPLELGSSRANGYTDGKLRDEPFNGEVFICCTTPKSSSNVGNENTMVRLT